MPADGFQTAEGDKSVYYESNRPVFKTRAAFQQEKEGKKKKHGAERLLFTSAQFSNDVNLCFNGEPRVLH